MAKFGDRQGHRQPPPLSLTPRETTKTNSMPSALSAASDVMRELKSSRDRFGGFGQFCRKVAATVCFAFALSSPSDRLRFPPSSTSTLTAFLRARFFHPEKRKMCGRADVGAKKVAL